MMAKENKNSDPRKFPESDEQRSLITRRRALRCAASLLGGTLAAAHLGTFMSRAAVAAAENSAPLYFDQDQFLLIEHIVDVMIPQTDTPGARAAGVHHFIDLMLAEWASPERQARYAQGLHDLGQRLQKAGGKNFVSLTPVRQLDVLRALDQQAYAEDATDTFYQEFKKLVLFGYYSSEAGATLELQYEPMTADYKACVPIDDIGRAWFWLGFSYGL